MGTQEWIQVFYILVVIIVNLIILYNTDNQAKTAAFILLVTFLPIVGIILYFILGYNYYQNGHFSDMAESNNKIMEELEVDIERHVDTLDNVREELGIEYEKLANYIYGATKSPITTNNEVEILVNGERKYPRVIEEIKKAQHHIYMEYYTYIDDETGTKIIDALIDKRKKDNVIIRFLYDDIGSYDLTDKSVKRMRDAGIKVAPFYELKSPLFANRINNRNHRKIIVIDGHSAFIGGINISNSYNNEISQGLKKYWRDTHIFLKGDAVEFLQYIFLRDWKFCNKAEYFDIKEAYPDLDKKEEYIGNKLVQIVASGPDNEQPFIHHAIIKAIYAANKRILISTPYFIPGDTLNDAIISAAAAGIDVQLLIPKEGDSRLVDYASKDYLLPLLKAGVNIFFYTKGFIHAKTMQVDDNFVMLGSANLDHRSFELNFEVNAVIYDKEIALEFEEIFENDKKDAYQLQLEDWENRSKIKQLPEKIARQVSPIL